MYFCVSAVTMSLPVLQRAHCTLSKGTMSKCSYDTLFVLDVASFVSFTVAVGSVDIRTSLLRSSSIFDLENLRLYLLRDDMLMHDADIFIVLAITLKESS